MTVLRGQYYQSKAVPLNFCFVIRVFSPAKIQMIDVDYNFQVIVNETQLAARYTLVPFLPENRVHSITERSYSGAHGFALTTPFVSGSVQSVGTATKHKAFAPTYLRGRLTKQHAMLQANLINPLVLGGYLAAQGRVVQAQADHG